MPARAQEGTRLRIGRLRKDAGVAGTAARGVEEPDLALPRAHGSGEERHARGDAGGVDEGAGLEAVAAVEHEVMARHQRRRFRRSEAQGVGVDGDVRVQPGDRGGGALDLGRADVGGGVDHLALEVRQADRVVVDDGQRARPRPRRDRAAPGCRGRRRRRRGAARPQPLLAGAADLVEHDVAGVALELLGREAHGAVPVEPKPPVPRALSARPSRSSQAMRSTGARTSWAIAHAVRDGEGLGPEVDEDDADLAAIVAVDGARRIDAG